MLYRTRFGVERARVAGRPDLRGSGRHRRATRVDDLLRHRRRGHRRGRDDLRRDQCLQRLHELRPDLATARPSSCSAAWAASAARCSPASAWSFVEDIVGRHLVARVVEHVVLHRPGRRPARFAPRDSSASSREGRLMLEKQEPVVAARRWRSSPLFPLVVTNPTYTTIGVFTLIFMACATSWNMFSGYSGYIALGSAVFYGIGAYTMAPGCRSTAHGARGGDVLAGAPRRTRGDGRRGARRLDRAARASPHLRRHHDRDLLHLPTRGDQLLASPAARRGCPCPSSRGAHRTTTSPSTTWPWRS